MTTKDFLEKYKGVRRTILAFVILWITACVAVGLYQVIYGGLGTQDTAFLTAVVALLHVPIAYYFHSRGKSS